MNRPANIQPKQPTEAQLQTACLAWFKAQYPNRLIFHIPNGGSRNPIEAKNLKAQGVLKGVPDLFIPEPCTNAAGLFIEMKRNATLKPRPEQAEMLTALNAKGYAVALCGNFEHFQKIVNEYFAQFKPQFKPKSGYEHEIEFQLGGWKDPAKCCSLLPKNEYGEAVIKPPSGRQVAEYLQNNPIN